MICNMQGTVLCIITRDKGGFQYVYVTENAQLWWIGFKAGSSY